MAAVNTQFETQLQELQIIKANLETSIKQNTEAAQQQMLTIAEQVAAVAAGNAQTPNAANSPLVDAQLTRVRAYVSELQEETKLLKEVRFQDDGLLPF